MIKNKWALLHENDHNFYQSVVICRRFDGRKQVYAIDHKLSEEQLKSLVKWMAEHEDHTVEDPWDLSARLDEGTALLLGGVQ